jgi:hypothetical protein
MLSPIEVVLNSFVIVLLPLAVHALITRKPVSGPLGRLYATDPNLSMVSNVFLISICFSGMGRLALHFGLIDPSRADLVQMVTGVPFTILLVVFLAMLVRAFLRLRREGKTAA